MLRSATVFSFTGTRVRFLCMAVLVMCALLAPLTLVVSTPVSAASLRLSAVIGSPGNQVTFSGTTDNATAKWSLHWGSALSAVLASGVASAGAASGSFTVPETASGPYTIFLREEGSGTTGLAAFTVTPSINVNPTTAKPGASIKVEGHGFFSSETGIYLTLDEAKLNAFGLTADASGRWSATITLPEVAGGPAHAVNAFGSSTLTSSLTPVAFTVTPVMTASPLTGGVGSQVRVSGKGFAINETGLTVTWDGTAVASASVGISGSWDTTFSVPRSTRGTHVLDAYGATTPATSIPDLSFVATSGISITPESGPAGTVVTVTATGFAASETDIVVALGARTVKDGITADGSGRWTATFTIPAGVGGSPSVNTWGPVTPAGSVIAPVFQVTPRSTLGSVRGKVGDTVTVSGSSFAADDIITVYWDGPTAIATFNAGASGDFNTTFKVPAAAGGDHPVRVTGSRSAASVDSSFTVDPGLVVTPSSGNVGSTITLNGSGFGAGRALTVTWDGAVVTLASGAATGAQGGFTSTFPAPRAKSGGHTLKVSDGAAALETAWNMEGAAPPAPAPLKPARGSASGLFGDTDLAFEWSAVSDPSGLTYTLQLARDEKFNDLAVERAGLTAPTFTLARVAQGTWYWRVKAVDAASNESAWSTVSNVRSGFLPVWLFALIVISLLGAAAGAVLWIRRRPWRSWKIPSRDVAPGASGRTPETSPDMAAVQTAPPATAGEEDIERWLLRKVAGLTDRDIPGLIKDKETATRGLTAARIFKIIGRLEEKGLLAQTSEGRYGVGSQAAEPAGGPWPEEGMPLPAEYAAPAEEAAPNGSPPSPVPDTESPAEGNAAAAVNDAQPAAQPAAPGAALKQTPPPDEPPTDDLVMDRMEGLMIIDIPRVAGDGTLKARGVTLAGLFSLCARLEREGKMIRDGQGRYHQARKRK